MSLLDNQRLTFKIGATAGAVALGAALIVGVRHGRSCKRKKLHVEYDAPAMPLPVRIIASLPLSLRRRLAVKSAAPKPPRDARDLLPPEEAAKERDTTYTKEELVPDRIWRVRYEVVADPWAMRSALKNVFGVDMSDSAVILDRVPPDMRARVEADMMIMSGTAGMDPATLLREGFVTSQDMLVARLDTDVGGGGAGEGKGGLLLFNPCRMHPDLVKWIDGLGGKVEWIISGSSQHTNQLPQAALAYPDAKIMCAALADAKCSSVGMRPADFIYTDHSEKSSRGFRAARDVLRKKGVTLHHVRGDAFTQVLCVLAHGHLFVLDLEYGNGHRFAFVGEEDWKISKDRRFCDVRIFYYAGIHGSASRTGYIPNYRLMGMDPDSPLPRLMAADDSLAPDGSSCDEMARSLRELLKLDFEYVDSVHSSSRLPLSAAEFAEIIDTCWNWLDGKSLLPKEPQRLILSSVVESSTGKKKQRAVSETTLEDQPERRSLYNPQA